MSLENEFLTCVERLEQCVHQIKDITRQIKDLHAPDIRMGIAQIEEGVEYIEHKLSDDVSIWHHPDEMCEDSDDTADGVKATTKA